MTNCDVGEIPIEGECKTEEIMSGLNDSGSDIDEAKLNDSEEDPEIQKQLDELDEEEKKKRDEAMEKAKLLSSQSEAGKRRKKRKTRRRRKSKKSRKSRRRKGKKSRKSRRRRRRRTRKKKGGTHDYKSVENDKKEMVADAFNQKNLGKSYQEF